jgi:hypothetical protein
VTDRLDDLAPLIAPVRQAEISIVQGYLTAWNGTTHANTVEVGGATLIDLPLVHLGDPTALAASTVVLLLRVRNTYYLLGKVTYP